MTSTVNVSTEYHPPPQGAWERRPPADVGMDPASLHDAVTHAREHEVDWPVDLRRQPIGEDDERWAASLGQYRDRGGPCGLVLRHGYIVAEWGDLERVDLTYSASKSYVATMAGLACDRGRINSVDDRVAEYESRVVARAARLLHQSPWQAPAVDGAERGDLGTEGDDHQRDVGLWNGLWPWPWRCWPRTR